MTTLSIAAPDYCQVPSGPCDQSFADLKRAKGTFLYAAQPEVIATTIEGAVNLLRYRRKNDQWRTWKDFAVPGQTVFCEICKNTRSSGFVAADVTTLNFNVLFEIGFALGLGQPVVPIRDTSYMLHKAEFEGLGLLDTIGYIDFRNAPQLAEEIMDREPFRPIPAPSASPNRQQPLYVVKGPLDTDGQIRLMSLLKKSSLRYRTFDVVETPRLSLHEARKQVATSYGVIAHLVDPNREGATVHNARCALIAGIATASQKVVLLLQEGAVRQPIDYRDVVTSYTDPERLERVVEPFIRGVIQALQDSATAGFKAPEGLLEKINLGDVAAENEIQALRSYFVKTAQYNTARRGASRLLTGRKGAGKTAIFYAVRDSLPRGNSTLVLDLKPEGYQFTKLRDAVLEKLSAGHQEHTMTAFWEYILLCEITQKIRDTDYDWAQRDEARRLHFEELLRVYSQQPSADVGDFSERLLKQVEVLVDRFGTHDAASVPTGGELTQLLFRGEIRELEHALAPYLSEKEAVWLLLDNLDKGWPTRGARTVDILILRTLLDATRKLQRQLEQKGVLFHALVCLRNDIHEQVIRETPDRDKDAAISLDYDDIELFKEIVRRRLASSFGSPNARFEDIWPQLFPLYIGTAESFRYVVDRTLMRPRDLLNFMHRATETAINRGHERIQEDDVLSAEKAYSEDLLVAVSFELRDSHEPYAELLYQFIGVPSILTLEQVQERLADAGLKGDEIFGALEMLVWFGFLGVAVDVDEPATFAHQARYNVQKLLAPIRSGRGALVVHSAFHQALGIR